MEKCRLQPYDNQGSRLQNKTYDRHMFCSQIVPDSISILSTQHVCCVVMTQRMLKCRSLLETRDQFMEKISSILTEYQGIKKQKEIFKDFDLFAALILDCTAINLKSSETRREDFLHKNSKLV